METYAGIWLDHRKAIIYTIVGDTQTRHIIYSGIQTGRRSPGEEPEESLIPEHSREERLKHQLDHFYNEIIAYLQHATDILIIGPGEARTELKKAMNNRPALADKEVQIEPADRLTDPQIAARVREFTAKRRIFRHPLNHPYAV